MQFNQKEYHKGEGLLIKYYRLLANLSQEELEKKCHYKNGFVSRLEKGQNTTRDTRICLARAMGREPKELANLKQDWKVKLVPMINEMSAAFIKLRFAGRKAKTSQRKRKKNLTKVHC